MLQAKENQPAEMLRKALELAAKAETEESGSRERFLYYFLERNLRDDYGFTFADHTDSQTFVSELPKIWQELGEPTKSRIEQHLEALIGGLSNYDFARVATRIAMIATRLDLKKCCEKLHNYIAIHESELAEHGLSRELSIIKHWLSWGEGECLNYKSSSAKSAI